VTPYTTSSVRSNNASNITINITIAGHYRVPIDAAHSPQVPLQLKRTIVDAARQWPLYFSRFYPVVEDRRSEYVAEMLSIGETGIRLVARDYDDVENPLAVLDHFE
jgi:hypothetical protein